MMNLAVVTSLLIMLMISLEPAQAAGKRCWCDARINGKVIKSFGDNGVIASCGWLCSCKNDQMNRCGLTCDEKVQKWAETTCLKKYKGQQVRSHFKASTCKTDDGKRTYTCNYCSRQITKSVPYTCYKTVTQTEVYSCPPSSSGSSVSSGRSGVYSGRSGRTYGGWGGSSGRSGRTYGGYGSPRRSGVSSRRLPSASTGKAKMV